MNFIKKLFFTVFKMATSPVSLSNKIFAPGRGVGIAYISLFSLILAAIGGLFTFLYVENFVASEKEVVKSQLPSLVFDKSGNLSFMSGASSATATSFITDDASRRYVLVKDSSGTPFLLINPENATVNDQDLEYMRPNGRTVMFITLFVDHMSVNNGFSVSKMSYADMGLLGQTLTPEILANAASKTVNIFGLPFIFVVLFISFFLKALNCMFLAAFAGLLLVRGMLIRIPFRSICRLAAYALTGPMLLGTIVGIVVTGGRIEGYNLIGVWTLSGLTLVMMALAVRHLRKNLDAFVQKHIAEHGNGDGRCDIIIGPDGKILEKSELQEIIEKRQGASSETQAFSKDNSQDASQDASLDASESTVDAKKAENVSPEKPQEGGQAKINELEEGISEEQNQAIKDLESDQPKHSLENDTVDISGKAREYHEQENEALENDRDGFKDLKNSSVGPIESKDARRIFAAGCDTCFRP